jgi:hypothetical protein
MAVYASHKFAAQVCATFAWCTRATWRTSYANFGRNICVTYAADSRRMRALHPRIGPKCCTCRAQQGMFCRCWYYSCRDCTCAHASQKQYVSLKPTKSVCYLPVAVIWTQAITNFLFVSRLLFPALVRQSKSTPIVTARDQSHISAISLKEEDFLYWSLAHHEGSLKSRHAGANQLPRWIRRKLVYFSISDRLRWSSLV